MSGEVNSGVERFAVVVSRFEADLSLSLPARNESTRSSKLLKYLVHTGLAVFSYRKASTTSEGYIPLRAVVYSSTCYTQ